MTKLSCHAGSKAERGSVIPAELDLFQAFSGPDTFEDRAKRIRRAAILIRLELRAGAVPVFVDGALSAKLLLTRLEERVAPFALFRPLRHSRETTEPLAASPRGGARRP